MCCYAHHQNANPTKADLANLGVDFGNECKCPGDNGSGCCLDRAEDSEYCERCQKHCGHDEETVEF